MSKKTGSKSKLTKIILLVVLVIIAVGAGSLAYFDSQYNARIGKDKQRFETALADINKFFDENKTYIDGARESKSCSYDRGVWGDANNPLCTVEARANINSDLRHDLISNAKSNLAVLGYQNISLTSNDTDILRAGGENDGLICSLSIDEALMRASCYGRAEAQHYPRVDR